MVNTIKFSQMTDGGDIENNDKVPGLVGGENVLLNNPWTFLAPGTTAQRPIPAADMYYRLRFNTTDQLYEYYDAILGAWTQLQESLFTAGPIVIYTADAAFPDAQNLGALSNGILKQTISSGIATLNIAVNEIDYYGPGMVGYFQAPAGVKDTNGNILLQFQPTALAVNAVAIANAPTTTEPGFNATGTDTNIGLGYAAKGTGIHKFYSTAVIPFEIHNGTGYQRVSQFLFADVSGGFTYTFPQASGTIALTGSSTASVQGTANQVLVNGTSGSPVTGAVILTTPQDIGITSSPTFAALTVPLFKDANGLTALTIQTVASQVNYINIVPQPTGAGPVIQSLGSDTNINLNLTPKGGGSVQLITANPTNPLVIVSGTTAAHITNFIMANTIATRNVTFQDSSGTLAYLSDIPSVTPAALTKTDDTNVTLTLGGTPATALLQGVSLALGWTGTLAQGRGGTGFTAFGTGVATALQVNVGTAGSFVVNGGALGTPASGTLSACTGLPVSTGISGLGTGVATALAINTGSAGAIITFNGNAGTPSALVGTNITGTASGLTAGTASAVAVGGITGLGTGVATALAINIGSAGAFVTFNGAGGTPSSMVGTNITGTASGLTAGTASAVAVGGITGLGTGVATALAINVGSAGAFTTFNGAHGTPSSITLTNATGLPVSTGISGLGTGVATALAANVNGSGSIPLITSGSWTPVDSSGAGLSFTGTSGSYVRIGNLVIAVCGLTYPATVSGATAVVGGLPFASATNQGGIANYSTVATLSRISANASATTFQFYTSTAGAITNANMTGSVNIFQIIYTV